MNFPLFYTVTINFKLGYVWNNKPLSHKEVAHILCLHIHTLKSDLLLQVIRHKNHSAASHILLQLQRFSERELARAQGGNSQVSTGFKATQFGS